MKNIAEVFEEWYKQNSILIHLDISKEEAYTLFESAYLEGKK